MSHDPTSPTPAELARLGQPLDPSLARACADATRPSDAEVAALLARRGGVAVRGRSVRGAWIPLLGAGLAGVAFAAGVIRWVGEPAVTPDQAPGIEVPAENGPSSAGSPAVATPTDADLPPGSPIPTPPGLSAPTSPALPAPVPVTPLSPSTPLSPVVPTPAPSQPPAEAPSTDATPPPPPGAETAPPTSPVRVSTPSTPTPAAASAFAALLERRDAGAADAALLADIAAFRATYADTPLAGEAEVLELEIGAAAWPAARAARTLRAWLDAHPDDPRRITVLRAWATVVDARLHDCAAAAPAWMEIASAGGPDAEAARRRAACDER